MEDTKSPLSKKIRTIRVGDTVRYGYYDAETETVYFCNSCGELTGEYAQKNCKRKTEGKNNIHNKNRRQKTTGAQAIGSLAMQLSYTPQNKQKKKSLIPCFRKKTQTKQIRPKCMQKERHQKDIHFTRSAKDPSSNKSIILFFLSFCSTILIFTIILILIAKVRYL